MGYIIAMDEMLIAKCVASNICHEIANSISVIKFVEEDVSLLLNSRDNSLGEVLQLLFQNVDSLINSMNFFRDLYSLSSSNKEIIQTVVKMYEYKNVKISGTNSKTLELITNSRVEKIVAAVLFVVLKLSNKGNKVIFDIPNNDSIIINVKKYSPEFKTEVIKILNQELTPDVFNVIGYYVRCLAQTEEYEIRIDSKNSENLRIIICK
ncbi:MAG: hypothetical protein LBI26_02830 [Holosporales bacterium]|jgi:hypothetical protein|nr:hypothetical protein [Holosporales bacterium]